MTLINSNIDAINRRRAPSRTVGSYAVLELLGSGAFGSVYKVLHVCKVYTFNLTGVGFSIMNSFIS